MGWGAMFLRRTKLYLLPAIVLFWSAALAAQLRQIGIIDMPGHPGFGAVAFAGNYLVITHPGADTLDIFDPAKRRIVAYVHGLPDPHGVAVDEQGQRIFVANSGNNTIAVINFDGWKVERMMQMQFAPESLLYIPGLDLLYAVNGRNESLTVLHPNAPDQARTVALGGRAEDLAYDDVRKVLYCTVQDHNEVAVLTPELELAARYPLTASQPTGVAIDSKD